MEIWRHPRRPLAIAAVEQAKRIALSQAHHIGQIVGLIAGQGERALGQIIGDEKTDHTGLRML